ncbi:GSTO2 [Branchiostoma lanceolatum]|uniref:Glutathione S-transferase omega n=1 Tax=Branchiostoma lanceolatum TaxID=7740 RepID=A0A8K0A5S6_BRALA|nr:GSTO2 [Branchiostoma lanceolatum]
MANTIRTFFATTRPTTLQATTLPALRRSGSTPASTMLPKKAFKTGSTAPEPPAPGVLRLISSRFCPYAHRTRLVLAAKGIDYETVNVCLKDRPEWFFAINPLAKVPTLQHDGKVVYESLVCNEYLDRVFPGRKLLPEEPLEKARIGMLQAIWDAKTQPNFMKVNMSKGEEQLKAFVALKEGLTLFENHLVTSGTPFFGGDQPGFLDYSIWPWFELRDLLLVNDVVKLQEVEFPKLFAWLSAMYDRPEVKTVAFDLDVFAKYVATAIAGNPDSDIGLGDSD